MPQNIFAEALHGILCDCGETYNGNTGCPTSFPHALLMGASFNRSLWKEVAIAISDEGRAFANQGITGLYYWAPVLLSLFIFQYILCNIDTLFVHIGYQSVS